MLASRTSLAVSLAAVLALAGCVPSGDPVPTPGPSLTESASPTVEPTATPSPGTSQPVTIGCADLVSIDAMFEFNENFALLDDWTPDAGSLAAEAVAADGIACRWQNLSSGDTIDFAVAHPSDEATAGLKAELAASGTAASTYDVETYFDDATGAIQAFPEEFWLTVVSPTFTQPSDARSLVEAAIQGLD